MATGKESNKSKSISPKEIRKELILYLLENYGELQTKDIAEILGYESRTIRRSLKKLEESGKIESDKLGRSYIWSPAEEEKERLMYF